MAVLYLDAGIEKLKVPEWTEGTAVYYWINHNVFGAPVWFRELTKVLLVKPFFMTLTNWGVIILEILLFTALFLRQRYRYILFVAGFLFHFLIFIAHGLPTFWIAMSSGLIFYLWRMDFSIRENITMIKTIFQFHFSHIPIVNKIMIRNKNYTKNEGNIPVI